MKTNALHLTDSYKLGHIHQYPEGTEYVYSNWTPRGSRIKGIDEVVFFGLQYFLKYYLDEVWGEFFAGDIDQIEADYVRRITPFSAPGDIDTSHIRDLHALGYLPLEFKAVPEGSSVPLRVPMFTVENTDSRFAWLVNYMETLLSNTIWMPMTSATNAKRLRGMLNAKAIASGESIEGVAFQGHDFSMRGMSGLEAAVTSGAGHLISFTGTDSIPAVDFIEQYYPTTDFIAGSVPATEHSVMCAGGQDDEAKTYERLLDLYPAGFLSVVSDTWDLWKVITETLPPLKEKIMARDGRLVIRPDSGDPADILCGVKPKVMPRVISSSPGPKQQPFHVDTPEQKGVVELLWEIFGGTVNEKGFKVLDPHIGVIYGDSINYDRADDITDRLMAKGFASTNVVFGCGSYGYQHVTRDVFGFAMKATWVQINGVATPIFKDPATDNGTKKSLKGRVAVIRNGSGEIVALDDENATTRTILIGTEADLLQPVWKNGVFLKEYTFDEVRANALAD